MWKNLWKFWNINFWWKHWVKSALASATSSGQNKCVFYEMLCQKQVPQVSILFASLNRTQTIGFFMLGKSDRNKMQFLELSQF